MIAIKKKKTLKFQDGLKPYLKNKISILKLSFYLEVVDRALIAEKDNEKFHQYREQQRKRNRNDGGHGNQAQKRSAPSRNQNKRKTTQNLDEICPTCGKKHGGRSCYREELALVVENRNIWFGIVQRVRSLYLGSLRRRIKRIDKSPGLKGRYLL